MENAHRKSSTARKSASLMAGMYSVLSRVSRQLPRSRTKVRLGKLLARILPPDGNFTVRLRDGTIVTLDPRSRTEGTPFWDGFYDDQTIGVLAACLAFGPVVYDVGANVGLVALPVARHAAKKNGGQVIAFEPVPSNASRINEGIKLNGLEHVLRLFPVALGNSVGTIEMAVESKHGASTGNALIQQSPSTETGYRHIAVGITRLDDIRKSENIPAPAVIKLDVEGAEMLVILGAEETIRQHRPVILGEFHAGLMPKYGYTFLDVATRAKSWNYRIYKFIRDYRLDLITDPKIGMGDALLVPEEKAMQLEELFRNLDAKSPT